MKRKRQKLFPIMVFTAVLTAAFFPACDMIMINTDKKTAPAEDGISEEERDDLEKTGRFLKLTNMPPNTQPSNVYSASVSNSSAAVAKFDGGGVKIFRDSETRRSVYIPLVCADGGEFTETGSFYVSFSVHVDALTKYVVAPSDLFTVPFTDGRGWADAENLPSSAFNGDSPCLTLYNLPASVSVFNFSGVSVRNQTGAVASCADASQIGLSVNDNKASAKIPLRYISLDRAFTETGVFYVLFDINVDVDTRYTLTLDDKVKVAFINGNGYLDVLDMPEDPVPRLAVKGLPPNAAKHHVSNVFVYSASASPVAECPDYNNVTVVKNADSSSLLIPLAHPSDGARFHDSGKFAAAFSINVDIDTQIVFARSDALFLSFTDGSAEIDVSLYVKNIPNPADPHAGVEISETQRDALENSGHYLKLANMPPNTQATNVFSVSVSNSSAEVAKFGNSAVFIFRENDSCSIYLPLVYTRDNGDFLDTGFFYVSFTVHVDALTKYIVAPSDRFLVYFTSGRGRADVNALPSTAVAADSSRELSEKERDELENTGRYLKLTGLPHNTQTPNVLSASVANSSSSIAKLDPLNPVLIFREDYSSTAYLPLVYDNDAEFLENGYFYVAFSIHVDALSKYAVNISDRFAVLFADGRGRADVGDLPSNALITVEPRYLTVINLPPNASVYGFADVSVRDQKNAVAVCSDYSKILISASGGKAEAKIPLLYASGPQIFTGTGSFYVSLDISVDAGTRYTISPDDGAAVRFAGGDGLLDILNIPYNPVPCLTIKGLPLNASIRHLSDVGIYNLAGQVAGCSNLNDVTVVKENGLLTFLAPLSSSDGRRFTDSGRFAVSFTLTVDFDTRISYSRSDNVILPFTDGSAEFDANSFFGHFNAALTNGPGDSERPVIKAGSSFDVNGHRCSISSDFEVSALTPNSSCVLFLYAFYLDGGFFYEFSATAPTYNQSRKGWYNGSKRALWKMIYLYGSSQFLFKTPVADGFPHFGFGSLTYTDHYQITVSKPVYKSIDGAGNPAAEYFTLTPGVYAVELKGAGGGSGRTYNGTSQGGPGGVVREILTLGSNASFTAFTGSAGGDAPQTAASGTFGVITTKNTFAYSTTPVSGMGFSGTTINSHEFKTSDNILSTVEVENASVSMSGGGGGGGGSGTFLYCPDGKYLLAAGGGGGGSGGSYLTPGGGGGSGGASGPGAGGGGSGSFSQSSSAGTGDYSAPGAPGGAGGGYGGGFAGNVHDDGGSALSLISSNTNWLSGGTGASHYSPSSFDVSSGIPFLYVSSGTASNSTGNSVSFTNIISDNPILTVRTTFPMTEFHSGSGGGSGYAVYPTGPSSWLHTDGVGGKGASPYSLNPVSVTGSVSPADTKPGQFVASVLTNSQRREVWNYNEATFTSTLTLRIGAARQGRSGGYGGNNRNSSTGGGAASGFAGSITIYKIY